MKQSVAVGAQLLWSGRYGCGNGRYGRAIVMSYTEINKAASQWLLTFSLWFLDTLHAHPKIINMNRGVCDNTKWHGTYHQI